MPYSTCGIKPFISALLAAGLLLTACGGSQDDAPDPNTGTATGAGGFTLSVGPADFSAGQGQEAVLAITIKRDGGFVDALSVTLTDPPAGVTAETLLIPSTVDSALLPITIGAGLPIGSVYKLDVMAASTSVTHTGRSNLTVVAPQSSSQERIASGLDGGTLDYGTALLYRAYALHGDSRLPDAYLGAGSAREDNEVFAEITKALPTLPVAQQDALRPLVVRPSDPRSVWNSGRKAPTFAASNTRRTRLADDLASCAGAESTANWMNKRSASHPVRVWATCRGEAAKDAESLALIDRALGVLDKIYLPMTGLMGEPKADLEGVDGAIDFYILDSDQYVFRSQTAFSQGRGATTREDHAANPTKGQSAFVTINRSLFNSNLFHAVMIHEFFHVLQFAHNADFSIRPVSGSTSKKEKHWFTEASAQWAEQFFERTLAPWEGGRVSSIDVHRLFSKTFLPKIDQPLNVSEDQHSYSAYIWPYFVEQETKGSDFMKKIWDGLDGVSTFAEADKVIDGVYPFETNFKRFALRNLNSELLPGDPLPQSVRYASHDPDQFPSDLPAPPISLGNLVVDQEYSQMLQVKNLSARYVRLAIELKSNVIGKVEIDTSALKPSDVVDVQALVLTAGRWLSKPIELASGKASFCFDQGPSTETVKGSFQEILLIVSNRALAAGTNVSGALKVKPTSTPCVSGWEGSIENTVTLDTQQGGDVIHEVFTTTALMNLELDPDDPDLRHVFKLRSGSFDYRDQADQSGVKRCQYVTTASGPLHRALSPDDYSDNAVRGALLTLNSPAEPLPQYVPDALTSQTTGTRTSKCEKSLDTTSGTGVPLFLLRFHFGFHDITHEGTTIEGTDEYTETFEGGSTTFRYKWLLKKIAQ